MIELASAAVDSRARRRFALCLLAAAYIGAMLLDRNQQSDEGRYVDMARGLVGQPTEDRPEPDIWFGPGLPVLLAPLVFVHAPLEVTRLVGPALLVGAVLLLYEVNFSSCSRSASEPRRSSRPMCAC